jgi:hypothetical protein
VFADAPDDLAFQRFQEERPVRRKGGKPVARSEVIDPRPFERCSQAEGADQSWWA